jgi:hypothetical protein
MTVECEQVMWNFMRVNDSFETIDETRSNFKGEIVRKVIVN